MTTLDLCRAALAAELAAGLCVIAAAICHRYGR